MSTLRELAQLVIRRMSGGDQSKDSQIDPREVMLRLMQELNTAIKIDYYDGIRAENEHTASGNYINPIYLEVLKDSIRAEAYIIIPKPYVSLPHGKGIHQISAVKDMCMVFIPTPNGSKAIFSGLPAGSLEGRIGFYPEKNKVFFNTDLNGKGISKVLVKLVMADEDNLFIEPGVEKIIVDNTLKFFMPEMPQDNINDGAKQIRRTQ